MVFGISPPSEVKSDLAKCSTSSGATRSGEANTVSNPNIMIIKKAVLCNASLFFIEYLIQIIPPITVKILNIICAFG